MAGGFLGSLYTMQGLREKDGLLDGLGIIFVIHDSRIIVIFWAKHSLYDLLRHATTEVVSRGDVKRFESVLLCSIHFLQSIELQQREASKPKIGMKDINHISRSISEAPILWVLS
jgi:hypothetical protein